MVYIYTFDNIEIAIKSSTVVQVSGINTFPIHRPTTSVCSVGGGREREGGGGGGGGDCISFS